MLKISHLSKTFYQINKQKLVIDNLSLEVKKGQVFGFIGLNGAGKTTTIKMIVGLLFADKGTITINGKTATEAETHRSFGFMSESPQFYKHLTVGETLLYVGELFGLERPVIENRIDTLLKKVNLTASKDTVVGKLSKGMSQRLGFAAALINDPELIILDEPLDGLDPVGRLEFKQLITELKKQGKTIFFSTHILSDVEEICDRIAIINNGKIIAEGSPKQLIGKTKQSLEEFFVQTIRSKR